MLFGYCDPEPLKNFLAHPHRREGYGVVALLHMFQIYIWIYLKCWSYLFCEYQGMCDRDISINTEELFITSIASGKGANEVDKICRG